VLFIVVLVISSTRHTNHNNYFILRSNLQWNVNYVDVNYINTTVRTSLTLKRHVCNSDIPSTYTGRQY